MNKKQTPKEKSHTKRKSTMLAPVIHNLLKDRSYESKVDMVKLHEHILSSVLTDDKLFKKVVSKLPR